MECKGCSKSIPNDSVFCPYCKKQIRRADSPIADKLRKKIGKPAKGVDAPVDLQLRKLKKMLLLIGITVVVAALAGGTWFMVSNTNGEETDTFELECHIFSDPLPDAVPIRPLQRWLPDEPFNSLIWGDYIVVLSEDTEYTQQHTEYTQMLDGASLTGLDLTEFLTVTGMRFEELSTEQFEGDQVSILPLRIVAGPNNFDHRYVQDFAKEGYGFISYWVYSERYETVRSIGLPYKVEGNRILLFLEWWHSGDESAEVEVYYDTAIEIEFYFEGFHLILERSGATVTMIPRRFVDFDPWLIINHQVSGNHEFAEIKSIEYIATPFMPDGSIRAGDGSFISFSDDPDSSKTVNIDLYSNGIMRICKDGEAHNPESTGHNENVLWVRYIWCGSDGLILIDDNGRSYLYQEPRREESPPVEVIEETPEEVEELTLLERLEIALTAAGIEHNIDMVRGTVTADTSVLFDVSRYELSEEGMEYLKKYLNVLADILQSDDYSGSSVARIIVEGHTCSIGSYGGNMRLSERRAAAVKNYAMTIQPELAEMMDTIGMSYDDLIFDEHGNEDHDASRRVVFRFVLGTPVT